MKRVIGTKCPVCNEIFDENDDIVVCPICGTPHHRECYKTNGRCANEDNHGKVEENWAEKNKSAFDGNAPLKCPSCNTTNPINGIFCQICGTRLDSHFDSQDGKTTNAAPLPISGNPFTTPFGGLDPEEIIDDVTVKDITLFVGMNSFYFLPKFKEMFRTKKNLSWNWPAFFFNFLYFFYRKMYLIGAILLAFYLITSVPSFLFAMEYSKAYLPILLSDMPNQVLSITPELEQIAVYVNIATFLQTVSTGIFAVFANKFYYKHVLSNVKRIKSHFDAHKEHMDLYALYLAKKGRVSMKIAITIVVALIFLLFFFSAYISNLILSTL